jgi:diguanylate cyclase (GGDEF)-like protein
VTLSFPADRPDSNAAGARMYLVIHYVTYVGIVAHAAFIGLFAWLHVPALALFNIYSVASWVAARAANARNHRRWAAGLLLVEVVSHAVLAVWLLGWDSGFHYYLIPVIPFLIFDDDVPTRAVVAGAAVVTGVYVALHAFARQASSFPVWLQPLNIAVPLLALGVISYYFRMASIDAEHRMAALAMTDALTQLPNRRQLRAFLEQECVRSKRSQRPFAVILGDVDGFKQINDRRGHECGDEVLRAIAGLLRGSLRGQDQVARWGGEEFLVLLPETDLNGAQQLAEKLRMAVERFATDSVTPPVTTTMTFGVAQAQLGAPVDDCLRRADAAMYAGKGRGKNCVVAEEATPPQELRA